MSTTKNGLPGRRIAWADCGPAYRYLAPLALAVLTALSSLPAAHAQELSGCTVTTLEQPRRQALDCGKGLLIEIEPSTLLTREDSTAGNSFDTRDGAVLIEVGPEAVPFQIRTPHAIASVRGTVFVVDVTEAATSVLTVEGSVEVEAPGGGTARLGPGEGVDVTPGLPVLAGTWPAERAAALLARFGR